MPKEILTPEERRERNRQEMIAAILNSARRMMREDGAAALNLSQVARDVGVKPPSLYEYFPGKMAIYDALFRLGIEMYGERIRQMLEKDLPFWETFQRGIEIYFDFAQENPELYQIVFERPVPGFEPTEETMEISWRTLADGRKSFQELLRKADIETDLPVEQAFDLMVAISHGITSQHLANEPHLPRGQGRYGSLIPAAVDLFRKAWDTNNRTE